MTDDILAGLNPQQQEAVLYFDSPLLIIAGAGTGKTRVITHKIAYLVKKRNLAPHNILGVTFTNKAADEMKSRVEALTGIAARLFPISTFHALGLRLLRESGGVLGFSSSWKVIDQDEQKRIIERLAKEHFPGWSSDMRDGVIWKINLAKMNLCYSNRPDVLENRGFADDEIRLFSLYFDWQRQQRLWDYEDLISFAVRLLEDFPEAAEKYRRRFQYVVIDEFQDINPNQYELIRLLASTHRSIAVVGDDDQAIYSWRGASIRFLYDFERDFPNCKIVKLEQNYRSTPQILRLANQIVGYQRLHGKKLFSERSAGAEVFQLPSAAKEEEAANVARLVELLEQNCPQALPVAVLYRINSQSLPLETEFLRRRIPFRIIRGLRFFEHKEIKDCLAMLRLVYDADDDLAFLRVIDCLPLGIGEKTVETLALSARQEGTGLFRALAVNQARKFAAQPVLPRIAELQLQLGQLSVSAMLDELLEISGYRRRLEERDEGERLLNLTAFAEFVRKWEAEEGGQDFFDLLGRTSLESRPAAEEQRKPVYLLTMHNAKGLEFPTVILAGINATYMPFFLHRGKEELAEERRLFYVACTRACDLLVLSTASLRRSPFLAAIPPAILHEVYAPEDVLPALLPERRQAEAEVARRFVEHPIFGRGWILEELPGKKFLIDFADKGKKVIDGTVVALRFL